jgi:hypothetical protein
MNEKKYLVHLDILGFERLAEKIEEERGIESREGRKKFIDVLNERMKTIEREGRITGRKYGESDDWLLLTNSHENVFESILNILNALVKCVAETVIIKTVKSYNGGKKINVTRKR